MCSCLVIPRGAGHHDHALYYNVHRGWVRDWITTAVTSVMQGHASQISQRGLLATCKGMSFDVRKADAECETLTVQRAYRSNTKLKKNCCNCTSGPGVLGMCGAAFILLRYHGMLFGCLYQKPYVNLHKHICQASDGPCCDWPQEDISGSQPVHATFRESVEQLAGASQDYKVEGVNFLRSLLHPNPAMRMTADGALRHPFLTKTFFDVDPDRMPPEIT
jgi:hypothetical protein